MTVVESNGITRFVCLIAKDNSTKSKGTLAGHHHNKILAKKKNNNLMLPNYKAEKQMFRTSNNSHLKC